ncbi:M1 family peptidase [Streptomyces corynorhini]|uniref:M1 family peptidase n=1 Tax=Streptomyces corynorhini TaxID=2282652 RepID=A0A370BDZ2_9ACTN|nr:M1 family peptidase [Streptomyces corynorhini]
MLLVLTGCTGDGIAPAAPATPAAPANPATPANPADPVGASGLGDPYFPRLGNGGYDVRHYGLTLDYTPATGRLTGTADITARATRDLGSFHLDLAGLTVDSASVGGADAAVRRAGTKLTLRPRERLRRGETFRTVVRYSGVPRRITDPDGSREGWLGSDGRAVALGEPTGSMAWFPGNHHPSDKASYDIRITVPAGLKAISNGELRSERTKGGRTAFDWHVPEPMASYLATVAIGPYRTHETKVTRSVEGIEGAEAAEDTGTTEDTRDAEDAEDTGTTEDTKGTGGAHGTVSSYTAVDQATAADPATADDSAKLLAAIPGILKWGEKNFGAYPFSATGLIIGRPGQAGYALETQTRPFLPGPTDTETLVHELAHQWFGDSVTPKSWRDMWLSEGFATYAEWLWLADHRGVPVRDSFAEAYADEANWAFPPAVPPSAAYLSEPPVYGRGAMVLQRVREALGDAAFFRVVRGWARTHRHGNADTADFTAYVERRSGRDLGPLWAAWLYGDAKPPRG